MGVRIVYDCNICQDGGRLARHSRPEEGEFHLVRSYCKCSYGEAERLKDEQELRRSEYGRVADKPVSEWDEEYIRFCQTVLSSSNAKPYSYIQWLEAVNIHLYAGGKVVYSDTDSIHVASFDSEYPTEMRYAHAYQLYVEMSQLVGLPPLDYYKWMERLEEARGKYNRGEEDEPIS